MRASIPYYLVSSLFLVQAIWNPLMGTGQINQGRAKIRIECNQYKEWGRSTRTDMLVSLRWVTWKSRPRTVPQIHTQSELLIVRTSGDCEWAWDGRGEFSFSLYNLLDSLRIFHIHILFLYLKLAKISKVHV